MNADHFFSMGHSHKVCEDYADSSEDSSKNVFAVVSDGCSLTLGRDGKPMKVHTDFGSRFLCRAACEAVKDRSLIVGDLLQEDYWIHMMALEKALVWARAMGFSLETLSATLLMARLVEDQGVQKVRVTICGDGVILARNRSTKEWDTVQIDYGGPPYYLRYELNQGTRREYFSVWKDLIAKKTYWDPNWVAVKSFEKSMTASIDFRRGPLLYVETFPVADYDMVGVSSDGLSSFTEKTGDQGIQSVPLVKVLRPMVNFRGTAGEFVNRRMKKALFELAEQGYQNQDDVSLAMIYLGDKD